MAVATANEPASVLQLIQTCIYINYLSEGTSLDTTLATGLEALAQKGESFRIHFIYPLWSN